MSIFKIRQTIPTNRLGAADLSVALADYVLMSETGLLGDILVHTGDSSMGFDVLNVGADGEVLTLNAGQPIWSPLPGCTPFNPGYTFNPAPGVVVLNLNFGQTCNTVELTGEFTDSGGGLPITLGTISGATISTLVDYYMGSGFVLNPLSAIANLKLDSSTNTLTYTPETGVAVNTLQFGIIFIV